MKVIAKSDIGKAREINQDCYYISSEEDNLNIYIIADGMGGYSGGEVASNLAVLTVKKYIDDKIKNKKNLEDEQIAQLPFNNIDACVETLEKIRNPKNNG